ncbi:glycosyltransferase [Bacillus sp. FJAT-28004]|uniref:glycosyltransferase n=1 Tax=Bacillus sp. FJAT-28004 TaxID=1679165 RepID=UPI0006B47C94|nr:glycosyltransferase [Bacillus sp. FJAT-28004]
MKKKLLFVIPSLTSGGGEKSLVNLLSQIDYTQYDVDLFLLNHEGLFMDLLPKRVHLLPLPDVFDIFVLKLPASVQQFLRRGNLLLALSRIMFSVKNRIVRHDSLGEQYSWKYLSKSLPRLSKQYDVAIGFLEKTSIYFCVEKVHALKKIGWIHTDYDKLGMNPKFDLSYFEKLDHIVTVSEECSNILKRRFPEQEAKINVIYNIVSPSIIERMADQEKKDVYERNGNEVVILSIGRLNHEKGFEMAIEACKILVERGFRVQWNIIGEGKEREGLLSLIAENGLANHFKLLGLKTNPYTYIKQANIYVQTSKFEGKSIAIDEAKILNKPIVVTCFNTAKDQINDGIDGLIVDMNAEAVASGIEKLITDQNLSQMMVEQLSKQKLGTEEEIIKLYQLLA